MPRYPRKFNPPILDLIDFNIDKIAEGKELLQEIHNRIPTAIIEYVYISEDIIDETDVGIDYVYIFQFPKTESKSAMIGVECHTKFNSRSIHGYHYAKKHGQVDDFLEDLERYSIVIPAKMFRAYIINDLKLSMSNESPKYWKNAENADVFIEGMKELSFKITQNLAR